MGFMMKYIVVEKNVKNMFHTYHLVLSARWL